MTITTFGLNLIGVGTPAPWRDEAATWWANQRTVGELLSLLGSFDAVHGAYYFVMRVWALLFGDSMVSLRMASVVAIAVGAGLMTLLAAELFGPAAAPWTGMLYGIVPPLAWAAVEARSYALSSALLTAAMLAFWVAVRQRRWWYWVLYALLATAAVWVFFYTALAFVGLAVVLIWLPAGTRLPAILSTTAAAVASLPVVLAAFGQSAQVSWLADYRLDAKRVLANAFGGRVEWAAWLTVALLIAAIGFAIWRLREPALRGPIAGVLGWLLAPSAILLAISIFSPIYYPRYVTFSAPAMVLLLGFCISSLSGWRRWLTCALVATACAPSFLENRSEDAKDTAEPAAAKLSSLSRPGDGLYIVGSDRHALWWSFTGDLANLTNVGADYGRTWRTTRLKPASLPVAQTAGGLAGRDRLWIFDGNGDGLSQVEEDFEALGYEASETVRIKAGYPVTLVLMVRST